MIEEMYKEIILDHWRNPLNKGMLTDFDLEGHVINPQCGDAIVLRLKFKGSLVGEVSFDGEGCAISQASASLLTEAIKGKNISELSLLSDKETLSLLQIQVIPTRLKCALLPLRAVHTALSHGA